MEYEDCNYRSRQLLSSMLDHTPAACRQPIERYILECVRDPLEKEMPNEVQDDADAFVMSKGVVYSNMHLSTRL